MSLKDDLLRPSAYGSLRPASVELRETHLSIVFLLPRDVFKVKKSVDLGFLDFTTLDKRRAACEAEVRLNSRLAPQVYAPLAPVCRGKDGRLQIDGDGEIVDWAVHMKRLPDAIGCDTLLAEGKLGASEVEAIARRIAAFHAHAADGVRAAKYGMPGTIIQNMEENFAQTKNVLASHLSGEEAEEIVRWQRAFVRGHEWLFESRIANQRVRDGHGDLRVDHVYLEPAGPTIIDCIEFNERFRYADVCADIAFFSMDLASHGRRDLADRFIAAYARASDDYDLYALIDFYESYRAFVRGKVATMTAADPSIDDESRERALTEARRYFRLAVAAERAPLVTPSLVAVGGIIASGKSTIADKIADAMGAPVIDADRTRKAMLGVDATHPLRDGAWQGAYDPAFTERVYEEVLRRAAVVLESGRPAVIDASFRSAEMRKRARDLAAAHNVPFRFVECHADAATCRARLEARRGKENVTDGRLEIFDAFCARYEAVTELPSPDFLSIDTTRPVEESLARLRGALDTWPLGFVA